LARGSSLGCGQWLSWIAVALVLLSCARPDPGPTPEGAAPNPARNVLIFIGDGMGFEHVRAAGMYATGSAGTLSFEAFPYQGAVTTHAAGGGITDSAAAATAMATGFKVNNRVVSVAIPGDGRPLETVLEQLKALGKSTGLVTTTIITHATPAAFGAHERHRNRYSAIAADYLKDSRPNVMFGGARYVTHQDAADAGYAVVGDRAGMNSLDTEAATLVWGLFGAEDLPYELDGLGRLPRLSEMTRTALAILDNDPDGFFLMVEGGRIDHAGHDNDIERSVRETAEFANAVAVATAWARGRTDTLIIVTADHETGGLRVLENNGRGRAPKVSWAHTDHGGMAVPIYAWGANADVVRGTIDNTVVREIILGVGAGLVGQ
jgi:alkaline phosphatase